MITIDRFAYCNRIKHVNPMEKFIFSILTMGICLVMNSIIVSIVVALVMGCISVAYAGIPVRFYLKLLSLPIVFLVISGLTIIITTVSEQTVALIKFDLFSTQIGITVHSAYYGLSLFLKALGVVSCLYFLSLTTSIIDIISVLRRIKIPGLLLELMSLVYRFIFVLMNIANEIYVSQDSRLGYSRLRRRFVSMGQLISVLFVRTFKRSNDLYMALESRGYNGELRVMEEDYPVSVKNYIVIICAEILLVLIGTLYGGVL